MSFSTFNTATTGLSAAQRALDATSQNIVNSNTSNSKGPGQAKAVVFFILVAIISIAQLVSTRKKEVDQ